MGWEIKMCMSLVIPSVYNEAVKEITVSIGNTGEETSTDNAKWKLTMMLQYILITENDTVKERTASMTIKKMHNGIP